MQMASSVWLWALFVIYYSETTSTLLQTSTADKVSLNYRLPNETYPESYDIELTTNVHTGEKSFQGEMTIDIVVVNTTSSIVLNAHNLKILQATISNMSSGESEGLLYEYEAEREFLILSRKNNQQFAAKSKWKLFITYSGELRDDKTGFYLSKYTDEEGNTHYLAVTHFEAIDARYAFPCYDEPNRRANFTITINHSPNYTAISNMPVHKSMSSAGKTVFLTTPPIPTYVVAFAVTDFEYTECAFDGLPQRVYSRPNAKSQHKWALLSSMAITEYLSDYYGIKYVLPKIDHIALPENNIAATENFGLITYHESNLLYSYTEKKTNSISDQKYIANVIAHEISHQWFGGYVTIEWWTYHWLKEGIASIFSYKALEHIYPEWDVWQEFHIKYYLFALNNGDDSPIPSTFYLQKREEIDKASKFLLLARSGTIFHMWNNALSEKVFQRGLNIFLRKNQYSAVGEEELFTALQIAAEEENYKLPATISEMISTWAHQTSYPTLTVTRNYDDGTFTVKQEAIHTNEGINDTKTWYVPINFALASNPDFRDTKATHYLSNVSETKFNDVQISQKDWIILNKQSTGYYRINYDEHNWNLIAESLIERPFTIHHRNRAQLLHDAHYFSIYNRLHQDIFMKILSYLKHEDQYAPWAIAFNILSRYNHRLRGDKEYDNLKFFLAEVVRPMYKKFGLSKLSGNNIYHPDTRYWIITLACRIGVEECLEESNNKLKNHLKENISLDYNLEGIIYCNGLREADDETFTTVYQKLMNSTDQDLRQTLISNMGCSQNENQIKKFIYSSLDQTNNLLTEERTSLLRGTYVHSQLGFRACVDFLHKNWDAYGNLTHGSFFSSLQNDILFMASYVTNESEERSLLDLVAKVKNSSYVTASLEADVKKIMNNYFQWMKRYREPIMSWVSQYRKNRARPLASISSRSTAK